MKQNLFDVHRMQSIAPMDDFKVILLTVDSVLVAYDNKNRSDGIFRLFFVQNLIENNDIYRVSEKNKQNCFCQ